MDPGINPNSVVKLNVGGTIFQTTQGTLLSDQNSMSAKMFSTETNGRIPAIQDDSGGVVEKGANVDLKFLGTEAEYFCIEGLREYCEEEM